MNVRNLIFPMTAGDLVLSAQVLCQVQRGDGPDMRLCEVLNISTAAGENGFSSYTLKDTATYETFVIALRPDTPLLVTGIARS